MQDPNGFGAAAQVVKSNSKLTIAIRSALTRYVEWIKATFSRQIRGETSRN